MTALSVLSMVVALLALVVAGLSAKYTRSQAGSAASALHDMRSPILEFQLDLAENGNPHTLYVLNKGTSDLDSLTLEVVYPGNEAVPIPNLGIGNLADMARAELGPVPIGTRASVRAALGPKDARNPARFRAISSVGDQTWITAHELQVERDSEPNVW